MPLSERMRRLGKIAIIGVFGCLVFSVVFYLSLPYERFKGILASRLSAYGYEMEAEHAGPSLGLGMTLDEITLVSQSAGAAKPTRILIEKATLGWSLLSYLWGGRTYTLSADVFGGELDVKVKTGKSEASARASAKEINLLDLPWLKRATNLPAYGKLKATLQLDMPKLRASEAKGQLAWSCASCALGNGKAKLVIASHPLLAEGLGLPRIRLGDFTGKVVIDKGVGRLHGVQFKSPDLEATVEGEVHLAQPLGTSRVDLYVRFKLSDSLLRSSEKLRTIMDLTAMMGKRPDGFLGFRVTGTLRSMSHVQWLKTSPFTAVAGKPRPASPPAAPAPRPAAPPPSPPVVAAPPAPPPAPVPAPVPPPPPAAPPPVPAPPAPPPAPAAVPTATPPAPPPTTAPPPAAAPTSNPKPGPAPPAAATAPPPPSAPPAPGPPAPPTTSPAARAQATPGTAAPATVPSPAAPPTGNPKPGAPAAAPPAAAAAPPPVIILPAPFTGTPSTAARTPATGDNPPKP